MVGLSDRRLRLLLPAALLLLLPVTAAAQSGGSADPAIDPPPPVPPEVVSRDAGGRVTLRAIRLSEPLVIDGRLDEEVYTRVPPVGDFIQQEPNEGQPATERTEAWVFFDDQYVYVSARCWDSQPHRMVASEMRRDHMNLFENENFGVIFDTFHDRRNGFLFYTTPIGGFFDGLITDEGNNNRDWNTVWRVRTGRFEGGWTVEMAIPFKSLRYRSGGPQVWGINFRRVVRWKNELSYLTPIAAAYGRAGVMKLSSAGTLVGLEAPPGGRNMELKPYAIAGVTTDRLATPVRLNDPTGDVGLDFKYGLTPGLTLDLTWNTDFAQVEDDEQQVNLTRFSLFFPEKREFFLEGQGIFAFGGVTDRMSTGAVPSETPVLFFSRRIGLSDGRVVPIQGGGRLTGRLGSYTLGALNIRTDGVDAFGLPATNFTVVRVKRDVLRRSNIGFIGTHRAPAAGDGTNTAAGIDANFSFHQNLDVVAYYARTRTPGLDGDASSYRGRVEYAGDRYGFSAEHLAIGRDFRPGVGFLRRSDLRRSHLRLRYSPRPLGLGAVRKFTYSGQYDYLTDMSGRLLGRLGWLTFRTDLENGDSMVVDYSRDYEHLDQPFAVGPDFVVPAGGYGTQGLWTRYEFGPQRRVRGMVMFSRTGFFGGRRHELTPRGRIEVTPRLSLEPRLALNWISLPQGEFSTRLLGSRVNFTITPRMLLSGLTQYNSSTHTFVNNVRFRWEYVPGSELFLVYSDGRDTRAGFPSAFDSRSVMVKVNRLVRF